MNREPFLSRVRMAAAAGRRYRVHVDPVPAGTGYVGATGDLCDALAAEVALVGGEPLLVPDWSTAAESLSQLLRYYHARSAICWEHPAMDRLSLTELLAQQEIVEHRYKTLSLLPESERRALILAADVGISSADFAIAETGSLAVFAKPGQERVISLVPPVHIAVIAGDQIVPDLFDVFAHVENSGLDRLPSNWALISGPSKTGDIELELTTGVHGPGKWHVVIVREPLIATSHGRV